MFIFLFLYVILFAFVFVFALTFVFVFVFVGLMTSDEVMQCVVSGKTNPTVNVYTAPFITSPPSVPSSRFYDLIVLRELT